MPGELDRFVTAARAERGALFEAAAPIVAARAPAWIDLMGGSAAAGGALALGWPLGAGALVALQPTAQPVLLLHETSGAASAVPLGEVTQRDGSPREYADAAARLAERPLVERVAGGVWLALMREEFVRFPGGARALLRPAGGRGLGAPPAAGAAVGLGAALAQALVSAFKIHLAPRELAFAVQTALARVAGFEPGALGPLVSVCAHGGSLLPVHQQPRWLWGELHLPPGTAIWAIVLGDGPPGVAAERAEAATAMAYALAAEAAGLSRAEADGRWLGYLANLGTPFFEARVRGRLPAGLAGGEFLARFGAPAGVRVEPDHVYQIRAAAALALEEHLRSRMTAALLRAAASKAQRDEDLALAGELMARSHGGQRAAELGDPRADALVEQIYAEGASQGLYGARAAAAASGATLVALGRAEAEPALRAIVEGFGRATGLAVTLVGGSSSGASAAGTREVRPDE